MVTTLYSANAHRVDPGEIWLTLGIALCLAIFFMLMFSLNPFTNKKMPMIASVFTLAAILFYEIHPITAGVLMLGAIAFVKFIKAPETHNKVPTVIAFICVIGILVSVGQAVFLSKNDIQASTHIRAIPAKDLPNIYFIMPDRMPSIDAMQESGIDTAGYTKAMRDMGFYIKDNQLSLDPYSYYDTNRYDTTRTMRFFASVLNNGETIPLTIKYPDLRMKIRQPKVFDTLHDKGYTIINIGNWFAETKVIETADFNLKYDGVTAFEKIFQDELSVAFWKRSVLNGVRFLKFQSEESMVRVEQGRVKWQADEVKAWGGTSKPVFIMAHIMIPHEPYVFSADGNPVVSNLDQPSQYHAQIKYTLTYLQDIATCLVASDPTAIIIIQSDEGMAFKEPKELNYVLSPTQWNGVMTAWRIPGSIQELDTIKHTQILDLLTRY